MNARLRIEATNLHWLYAREPHRDLCAHGGVRFILDDAPLVESQSESHALSSAAVCLLRTLWADQDSANRVCDSMIPCCGFQFEMGHELVLNSGFGCPYGMDFLVEHEGGLVKLGFDGKVEVTVSLGEWCAAVVAFSDQVVAFYRTSEPKVPQTYEERGYFGLLEEWRQLLAAAVDDISQGLISADLP